MSYTNMIVELEEAVEKSVATAIRDADIADLVTNILDNTNIVRSAVMLELDSENVLTRDNFDPSDYDVLNADEVEYKIEEVVSYKVEEMMSDENSSLLARVENIEEVTRSRIEEVVSCKVEELMNKKIEEFDERAHDNELIPLVDRIEKLEDKLLAIHRLLGHAADVITYLNTFQAERPDEL